MPLNNAFIVPHPPLIVSEVGRGEERKVQGTVDSFDEIARTIAHIKPDTIIVASPHAVMYGDYIHVSPGKGSRGDLGKFGASGVSIAKEYDTELVSKICEFADEEGIPAGVLGREDTNLDHGVLVPMFFIEKYYKDYKLVRASISGLGPLEHYAFGICVARAAEALGRNAVFLASGDLSHKLTEEGPYGYAPEGPEFDRQATDAMKNADFLKMMAFDEEFTEAAAECGLRSFIEMAGALDGKALKSRFLSYEGTFGVGYALCAYSVEGIDEERKFIDKYETAIKLKLQGIKKTEDEYVRLARQSLETYIRTGRYIGIPEGLPEDISGIKAGVFVSLKKNGRLRGCIGTITATEPSVALEIIKNAVSAGTGDPRFEPVEENELGTLVYSVDVLGKAEGISSKKELDPKRYGVIVTKGYRRGLLLPNLEGIDTADEQVSIALEKAGILPNEDYSIERFEVVRHK